MTTEISIPALGTALPTQRDWGRWLWRRFPVILALFLLTAVGWTRWADWKRNELAELLSNVESRYRFEDPDILRPLRHRAWNRLMRSLSQSPPLVTEVRLSGPEFDDDWFRRHESKFAWRQAVSLQLNVNSIPGAEVPLTYATIQRISRWSNLVALTINGQIQGEPDVERLGNFQKLALLSALNSLRPEVIAHIVAGGQLERVTLSADMVTPDVVKALSRNPRLKSIQIETDAGGYDHSRNLWIPHNSNSFINDDVLRCLTRFTPPSRRLDELNLQDIRCTSSGLASLAEFKWARHIFLEIHGEGLDVTAFDRLAECGNISGLVIWHPTDDTLRHLAKYHPQWNGQFPNRNGPGIYLRGIPRTENTLSLLKNLGHFPHLKIYDPAITDEEYPQLQEALPNLPER